MEKGDLLSGHITSFQLLSDDDGGGGMIPTEDTLKPMD